MQNNLKWDIHITEIIAKANKKLFMLRRLKRVNLTIKELVTVYKSYVRPILEYAAPLWHSSITEYQSRQIESIQKRVSRVILGNCFTDYGQALDRLHLEALSDRRMYLCTQFIQKAFTSNLFTEWFPPPNRSHSMTLRSSRMVEDFHGPTKRFHNSPIPYLTRLLNSK